jgi:Flp pilus assembly protein TadG
MRQLTRARLRRTVGRDRRAPRAGRRGERGSMTVEFVIVAPLVIGLMLFLVLAGRVVEAHGQVDGAARDAARAASVARTAGDAQAAADLAVRHDTGTLCQAPQLQGYAPGSTAVVITLHCTVDLTFISHGTMAVTGYAVAPLDQFVARTY